MRLFTFAPNRLYFPPALGYGQAATGHGILYATPFIPEDTLEVVALGVRVAVAGAGMTGAIIGIYDDTGNKYPNHRLGWTVLSAAQLNAVGGPSSPLPRGADGGAPLVLARNRLYWTVSQFQGTTHPQVAVHTANSGSNVIQLGVGFMTGLPLSDHDVFHGVRVPGHPYVSPDVFPAGGVSSAAASPIIGMLHGGF